MAREENPDKATKSTKGGDDDEDEEGGGTKNIKRGKSSKSTKLDEAAEKE